MPRIVVGLLAATGAAMAAVVGYVHGDADFAVITAAATASGLAAYLALPGSKNIPLATSLWHHLLAPPNLARQNTAVNVEQSCKLPM
jgi:hypothetical protein